LGIAFLEFFHLFCSEDIAIVHFDSGVLFDLFAEGGLGNAVFLTELGVSFTILVKGDERFFKIFIVFGVVVYSHKGLLFSV